jgi:hypothetical protein
VRESVVFYGASDRRCHRGELVVGEVNYRHGPGYRLADDRCKVRYAVRGLNDQIRRRAARMAVPPAGRRRLRLNLERLMGQAILKHAASPRSGPLNRRLVRRLVWISKSDWCASVAIAKSLLCDRRFSSPDILQLP